MDTQAGAQSATNSHQTTIDLQAGIIASHQDEIGRANVRITDQAAEIARLNLVLADRQAKIAELMGAVVRAEMAAPAAPSEQAEASGWKRVPVEPTAAMIEAAAKADDEGFEAGRSHGASGREIFAAMVAAAPNQPAQPEQSAFLRAAMDFAQAHINCDEIESAYESNPESGSEADTAEVDGMYNVTKKRLVESYRALNSAAPLAGAAPLPELTGPSAGSVKNDQKLIRLMNAWDLAEPGKEANDIFDQIADYLDSRLAASPSPAPAPTANLTPDALRDAVAEGLKGLYYCGRVWSAWGVGTMSEDDFTPAEESDECIDGVIDAINDVASRMGGITSKESAESERGPK